MTDKLYFAGFAVVSVIAYVTFSGFVTFTTVEEDGNEYDLDDVDIDDD